MECSNLTLQGSIPGSIHFTKAYIKDNLKHYCIKVSVYAITDFINAIIKESIECSKVGNIQFSKSVKNMTIYTQYGVRDPESYLEIDRFVADLLNTRGINFQLRDRDPLEITISWQPDHPYLNPKPILATPEKKQSLYGDDYWKLFIDQSATDVTFLVNGEEIKAHKFPLLVSPVFLAMFTNGMRETSSANSISLSDISSKEIFLQFMQHFYLNRVDEECLKDPNICIELLEMANAYQVNHLIKECAKSLEEMIHLPRIEKVEEEKTWISVDPKVFFAIANIACSIDHEGLIKVCQWFLRAIPTLNHEGLLEGKTIGETLKLLSTAKRLSNQGLEDVCYHYIEHSLSLDSFLEVVRYTIMNKDKRLNKISKAFGKQQYKEIHSKRKDTYQEHWKLYKIISTIPTDDPDYTLPTAKPSEKN